MKGNTHLVNYTHLVTCMPLQTPESIRSTGQVYDCIEVFSGVGTLSRCLTLAGYTTASLDIELWEPWAEGRRCRRLKKMCKGNPLDLLSPAGFALLVSINVRCLYHFSMPSTCNACSYRQLFCRHLRLLLHSILQSKEGVVVAFGLVCSTFISISRGSTHRSYFLPEGDLNAPSVVRSNLLAARTFSSMFGYVSLCSPRETLHRPEWGLAGRLWPCTSLWPRRGFGFWSSLEAA